MADDFYEPLPSVISYPSGLVTKHLPDLVRSPTSLITAILVTIAVVIVSTRLLSGNDSELEKFEGKDGRTVWLLPYWIPFIGHGYEFLVNPMKLMREARDQSTHGIFALNMGAKTLNVVSDPSLVKGVMQQKESAVQFYPITWAIVEKFFGVPKSGKPKYDAHWEELMQYAGYLMREPHLSNMLKPTMRNLEDNIPQMISFMDSEIDQQPWERFAKATYISDSETELNFCALMRDMMGSASVPGLFGRALMDKYPDLLHDVYDMDAGLYFFSRRTTSVDALAWRYEGPHCKI